MTVLADMLGVDGNICLANVVSRKGDMFNDQ